MSLRVAVTCFDDYALAVCLSRGNSMPELPEVEVICRGIRPHLLGRSVEKICHSGKMLRSPVPVEAMQPPPGRPER